MHQGCILPERPDAGPSPGVICGVTRATLRHAHTCVDGCIMGLDEKSALAASHLAAIGSRSRNQKHPQTRRSNSKVSHSLICCYRQRTHPNPSNLDGYTLRQDWSGNVYRNLKCF